MSTSPLSLVRNGYAYLDRFIPSEQTLRPFTQIIIGSIGERPVATIIKTAAAASLVFALADIVSFIFPFPIITPLATRFTYALVGGVAAGVITLCLMTIQLQLFHQARQQTQTNR